MTQFLVRPKASRRRKQFVLPMVLFLAVAAEEKTQAKAKSATGLTCYATLRACLGIPLGITSNIVKRVARATFSHVPFL